MKKQWNDMLTHVVIRLNFIRWQRIKNAISIRWQRIKRRKNVVFVSR